MSAQPITGAAASPIRRSEARALLAIIPRRYHRMVDAGLVESREDVEIALAVIKLERIAAGDCDRPLPDFKEVHDTLITRG